MLSASDQLWYVVYVSSISTNLFTLTQFSLYDHVITARRLGGRFKRFLQQVLQQTLIRVPLNQILMYWINMLVHASLHTRMLFTRSVEIF